MMDQPTCYTVICLLTGACGALLYLWHRAASRLPGEYRQVAPAVELPPTGALAEDLYAAHRGARMMVDKSTCPPLALAGCDDGQRAGWRAVAVRVETITRPPKMEGALMVGGRGTLTSIPVLVALGLLGGCASQLTRDRQQLTAVLQVQRAAVVRLQSGDAACQGRIVAAAKTREMAVRQLAAYRDRRRAVEQLVAAAAQGADEAQDQLLLSDSPAAQAALVKARAAAAQLRAQVQQLVEGC